MSIKFIGERQGSASRQNGKLTATRVLLFLVTDGENPVKILLHEDIPPVGSEHPEIPGIYAGDISSPTKKGGSAVDGGFEVTIKYTPVITKYSSTLGGTDKKPWELPPFDPSFDTREVVVPQIKAYQEGDKQFKPSKPVVHPATGEALLAETIETHGILSIKYNLKKFNLSWKKYLEGSINSRPVVFLGEPYPKYTLLLKKLNILPKPFISGNRTFYYYEMHPEIEDFRKEITRELAYLCFTHKVDGKIRPIQRKDGEIGYFDEKDTSLNVTSARYVDKSGIALPAGGTVTQDHYGEFPDLFPRDWSILMLPREKL